jgi:effector-binding domain-containing protein
MGFLDQLKGFWSVLRRLAVEWRLLAALVVILALGGVYLKKKFLPSTQTVVTAPVGENERGAPENKEEADKGESQAEAPAESVASQMIEVAARPVLVTKGQGKWDKPAETLSAALSKVTSAAAKAGLATDGRPLVVFTQTDDNGFHYEAMAPLAKAPDAKVRLPDGVEAGSSPAGKALKFEHRGSYDEIEATYEAITAYLDEKGLDTQNVFIEEYLTDLSAADDAEVDVDIYVFLK